MPKAANYTPAVVQDLVVTYTQSPSLETVDQLAVKYNRTPKSIIGKLVTEGVYQKQQYRNKLGEIPEKKEEILAEIEEALDLQLSGLEKSTKQSLSKLRNAVKGLVNTTQEAMRLLEEAQEAEKVKDELLEFHLSKNVDKRVAKSE